jgi:FAD/FMN-containing dehydrogenase
MSTGTGHATSGSTTTEAAAGLQELLRGHYIGRGAPGYDQARAVYNAMIDKWPEAIVRCVDVADVIAAVRHARQRDLRVAVRCGGHNGAGLGSVDDGLVIDLSPMRGVIVDPATKLVHVEAGATLGAVDHATHAFGLAVPGGSSRRPASEGSPSAGGWGTSRAGAA